MKSLFNLFREKRLVFRGEEVPNTKEGGLVGGDVLANQLEAIKFDEGTCREEIVYELKKALDTNDKGKGYYLTKVIWDLTRRIPYFENVTADEVQTAVDRKWSGQYLKNAFENAKDYMKGARGERAFNGEPRFEDVVKKMLEVEGTYGADKKEFNKKYDELAKSVRREAESTVADALVGDGFLDLSSKERLLIDLADSEVTIYSLIDSLSGNSTLEEKYLGVLKGFAKKMEGVSNKYSNFDVKMTKIDSKSIKADLETAKWQISVVNDALERANSNKMVIEEQPIRGPHVKPESLPVGLESQDQLSYLAEGEKGKMMADLVRVELELRGVMDELKEFSRGEGRISALEKSANHLADLYDKYFDLDERVSNKDQSEIETELLLAEGKIVEAQNFLKLERESRARVVGSNEAEAKVRVETTDLYHEAGDKVGENVQAAVDSVSPKDKSFEFKDLLPETKAAISYIKKVMVREPNFSHGQVEMHESVMKDKYVVKLKFGRDGVMKDLGRVEFSDDGTCNVFDQNNDLMVFAEPLSSLGKGSVFLERWLQLANNMDAALGMRDIAS